MRLVGHCQLLSPVGSSQLSTIDADERLAGDTTRHFQRLISLDGGDSLAGSVRPSLPSPPKRIQSDWARSNAVDTPAVVLFLAQARLMWLKTLAFEPVIACLILAPWPGSPPATGVPRISSASILSCIGNKGSP